MTGGQAGSERGGEACAGGRAGLCSASQHGSRAPFGVISDLVWCARWEALPSAHGWQRRVACLPLALPLSWVSLGGLG